MDESHATYLPWSFSVRRPLSSWVTPELAFSMRRPLLSLLPDAPLRSLPDSAPARRLHLSDGPLPGHVASIPDEADPIDESP